MNIKFTLGSSPAAQYHSISLSCSILTLSQAVLYKWWLSARQDNDAWILCILGWGLNTQASTLLIELPDAMAEWAEHPSPALGEWGIQTCQVRALVESNQWLKNWYLPPPSQVLGIIRYGHGLVGSVLELCDWVEYQVMVLAAWSSAGQHYKVSMSALSQVNTCPDMTLNCART